MRDFDIEPNLRKILAKLKRKDKHKYLILSKKMKEIMVSDYIERYKNLRSPLNNLKRVHINSHFVLVFEYDKNDDLIIFLDFNHHNDIYK